MIEKALARFNIAAAQSYFIGDRERDIMAGEAAGVKGILIDSNQSIAEVLDQIAWYTGFNRAFLPNEYFF